MKLQNRFQQTKDWRWWADDGRWSGRSSKTFELFWENRVFEEFYYSWNSKTRFGKGLQAWQTDTHTDWRTDTHTSSNLRLTYTKGPSGNKPLVFPSTFCRFIEVDAGVANLVREQGFGITNNRGIPGIWGIWPLPTIGGYPLGSPSDPLGFARDLRGIPRDLTRDPQLFIYQQFEGIPRDLGGIRKGFGGIPGIPLVELGIPRDPGIWLGIPLFY